MQTESVSNPMKKLSQAELMSAPRETRSLTSKTSWIERGMKAIRSMSPRASRASSIPNLPTPVNLENELPTQNDVEKDNSSNPRRKLRFSPTVKCRTIASYRHMPVSERCRLWYTETEFSDFRKEELARRLEELHDCKDHADSAGFSKVLNATPVHRAIASATAASEAQIMRLQAARITTRQSFVMTLEVEDPGELDLVVDCEVASDDESGDSDDDTLTPISSPLAILHPSRFEAKKVTHF